MNSRFWLCKKKQYRNFAQYVQFQQKPQNSSARDQAIFVDVLILHGLGLCNDIPIPEKIGTSNFDVRPVVQLVNAYFSQEHFKVSTDDVHAKYVTFSAHFRDKVMKYVEQTSSLLYDQINCFLNELRHERATTRKSNESKQKFQQMCESVQIEMSLIDFKRLVVTKEQYVNFSQHIQFLQKPNKSAARNVEIFVDALIVHGSGICHGSMIPLELDNLVLM